MSKTPTPSYEHYIINASDSVSLLVRIRDVVLTIILWALYFLAIRDSFPFVADLFKWASHGFGSKKNYTHLDIIPTIQSYAQVALVMMVIYLGWAVYNMLRFRGRQRRKPRAAVAPEDLANMYGFSPETVIAWQSASSLIIHHDSEGHLTDVKIVR